MATDLDLAALPEGGLVSESVISRLFNISPVDRPLIDSIGTGEKPKQRKHEYTDKTLSTPSSTEAFYENQDLSGIDNSKHGNRYGNYCQQQGRVIKTTQRARDSELTYGGDEFLQQLMDEGETLRLNEEAAAVSRNAARAESGTTPALMAGAATWAIRETMRGTNGVDAELTGTDTGPPIVLGGVPTTAALGGLSRGLTLTMIKDMLRTGWDNGAKYNLLMSTGAMIGNLSSYLFDKSARVATMQTDVPQGNRTGVEGGNGARSGGVVAQSAVNMLVGDFGTVVLTPNRLMEVYDSTDGTPVDVVDVLFIDTRYPMICRLHGYATKRLAQTGLYDQEVLFVDSTFIPGSTYAVNTIADINPATAVVA
jgi:hypothetical protein